MALCRELYRLPRRGLGNLAFLLPNKTPMGSEGHRYPGLSGNGPSLCNLAILHPNKTPKGHQGPPLSETILEWPSGPQSHTGST